MLIIGCFYFIRSEMKKNCFQVFHRFIKTVRAISPGSCKLNKIKFEPYGDLVDPAFSQFNEK